MRNKSLASVILIGCVAFVGLSDSGAYADTIVADGDFESPDLGGSFQYAPAGTPWNFTGHTGIAANQSAIGVVSNTGQAGFVQMGDGTIGGADSSVISQMFNLAAGSYTLSFDAEGRDAGSGSNPVAVDVYNQAMTTTYLNSTFTPSSTVGLDEGQIKFSAVSDSFTVPTAGQYGLYFVGQGIGGPDVTSFIDNVSVVGVPGQALMPLPATVLAGLVLMCGGGLLGLRRRKMCAA